MRSQVSVAARSKHVKCTGVLIWGAVILPKFASTPGWYCRAASIVGEDWLLLKALTCKVLQVRCPDI
jgi:hypothetical protein